MREGRDIKLREIMPDRGNSADDSGGNLGTTTAVVELRAVKLFVKVIIKPLSDSPSER